MLHDIYGTPNVELTIAYEDGIECFNDIDATKEKHIIKVKFKKL